MHSPITALLRLTERYTKTDMVYLASGGFWLFLGYGTQMVIGVLLSVAFANLLPKEAFGTYQFVISGIAILGIFTLTGMGTAVMRAGANGSSGALRYGVRTQLLWSVGTVCMGIAVSAYYFLQGNTLLASSFLVASLLQPLITGFSLYKWYLQGRGLFRESVIAELLQRVAPFALILLALTVTDNPFVIIATYFGAHALSVAVTYVIVIRRHKLTVGKNETFTTYSKHLSVMESLSELASALDKVLIWVFIGAAPLAGYVLAQMPVLHMQNIFGLVRSLAFPKLTQRTFPELQRILPRKMFLYALVVALAVGLYILIAPFLFGLLFPLYPEAVIYSQALALMVLFIPRALIGQAFAAHEKTRELYISNISTPLVRIVLLLCLLPSIGVWGAIIALIVTEVYGTLLQLYLFRQKKSRLGE